MSRFTGVKSRAMIDELQKYCIVAPWPFVLDIDKCSGMWLVTVDGDRIFDWAGHYGAKLIGYNHKRLRDPEYLRNLVIAANNKVPNPDFLTPYCLDYYRLLYRLAPACMKNEKLELYTINSGAEAVENMMKYMINLYDQKIITQGKHPETRRFLYFDHAFHGRTVFALNITQLEHDPVITKNFRGFIPGNIQAPFPFIDTSRSAEFNAGHTEHSLEIVEECLKQYKDEIVGIIVEPIQGAGGHRVAQKEFFQGLSRLAHDYEVYLGFDEVQTAGGQTGKIFACDYFDLPYPPQAVATAKKFGAGVIFMLYPMKDHGVLDSTWGGSLADMVRFCREWQIVEDEKLIEKVPEKAAALIAGLENIAVHHKDTIFNVRGMGLYQGFSLRRASEKTLLLDIALEQEGLLMLSAGTQTVRLRPPLDVTMDEINSMLEMLERSIQTMEHSNNIKQNSAEAQEKK